MLTDETNVDFAMITEESKDTASEFMGEQNQESADASKSTASSVATETLPAAATEAAVPEDKARDEDKASITGDMISDALMETKEAEVPKKSASDQRVALQYTGSQQH